MMWIAVIGTLVVLIGASAFFGAPYVPSRRRDVKRLFDELYPLSSDDVVFDAGSGDGLVLREVSRRGATAVGYEINPLVWAMARLLSARTPRVTNLLANFWTAPFPDDVTLVYIFSVSRDGPKLIRRMRQEASRLNRPLSLVCYGSPLPGLTPVREFEAYSLYTF